MALPKSPTSIIVVIDDAGDLERLYSPNQLVDAELKCVKASPFIFVVTDAEQWPWDSHRFSVPSVVTKRLGEKTVKEIQDTKQTTEIQIK